MLELRYVEATKRITGWCGDDNQFGNLKDRGGEIIIVIDVPLPPKARRAYLFNEATSTLIANPEFIEPEPPRDLASEVDELKSRVKALEPKAL